jgi:hypothetical protein
MKVRSSFRLDTGPPDRVDVEPTWLQLQAGQNRRQRRPLTASNNPPPRCSRQVCGLVALIYPLPGSVWSRLRKNCLKTEVRETEVRHG